MNLRRIINIVQKAILGYEVEALTFSQAGEDFIVRNFFYDRLSRGGRGIYVDIGAYHPYKHSNTYYLYRCGWRGINIDARPGSMKMFDKLRPEDINLETGISDCTGVATLYEFGDLAGLNTLNTDYMNKLGTINKVRSVQEVKTMRLDDVFMSYLPKGKSIDFMSLDVEGHEERVLRSNDWLKYRPAIIAVEIYGFTITDIMGDAVCKFLVENNYEFYARVILAFPGVNTVFFCDKFYSNKSDEESQSIN